MLHFALCMSMFVCLEIEIFVKNKDIRIRFKAGAPRTEHYQLVRTLSADAVVTVL